jgi:hypothetical protein
MRSPCPHLRQRGNVMSTPTAPFLNLTLWSTGHTIPRARENGQAADSSTTTSTAPDDAEIPRGTISHNPYSTACLRRCIAAIPVVGAQSYPFGFQRQTIQGRLYTVRTHLVHRCAHLVSSRVCSKDGRSRLSQRQLSTIGAVVHLCLRVSCDILK